MLSRFTLLFLSFLLILSCQSPISQADQQGLPDDFVKFYERFHTDSLYQMAHIRFPLEGMPTQADSSSILPGAFYWTQDQWIMHKPIDPESKEFKREFKPYSADMIVETIRQNDIKFVTMRRFFKQDGEWYLIYYMAPNKVKE